MRNGYQLPCTLDEWADFDFIGSAGPWVTAEKYELIERFKFYNRFAWGPERLVRRPLQHLRAGAARTTSTALRSRKPSSSA